MSARNIRNIGIFAHVDAGKTTLTERILALSGAIRQAGSVDQGTAHTDHLPVEQRRGISVKACCVQFIWKGIQINLIDTPGHVDFSAEIERSMWALDAAVLVVCGVEGVQPQTETLFHALKEQSIPTLLFINKLDRQGADPDTVIHECQKTLSADIVPCWDEDALIDAVCSKDEMLMDRYLSAEEQVEKDILRKAEELSKEGVLHLALKGSALEGSGMNTLLDAIDRCLPPPPGNEHDNLSGVVFAAQQDKVLGRGVWMRLYSGNLENRSVITIPAGKDPLTGEPRLVQKKITQIRSVNGRDAGMLQSGEIGVVYGLGDIGVGHVFGAQDMLPRQVDPGRLRTPLMSVQAIPEQLEEMTALRTACRILSDEDPLLHVQYNKALNQLQLNVMGVIQLEILQELLLTRFGLSVAFGKPAVIYRETISHAAEGYIAYLAPKPCWAILRFLIEPAPRGSGIQFCSRVHVRDLPQQYQNQVEQALPLALAQGRCGWQVDDVRITLLEGNSHKYHTHPLDFIIATPMGIQDGLERGGSTLLEPILRVRFSIPSEFVGRVMSDVSMMRGEVLDTHVQGDKVILNALIPFESSMDYSTILASMTRGRGGMSADLHGYRACTAGKGDVSPRRSVDPMDASKYILAARSALEGGIFGIE